MSCTRPGGFGVLSPKSYVDVPAGPRKSDILYTNFLPNFQPISIPFSKEKHPILTKLEAFYNNLPNVCNLGSFIFDDPPITIPNFAKKRPKRQAHIRIPCQCEERPPALGWSQSGEHCHTSITLEQFTFWPLVETFSNTRYTGLWYSSEACPWDIFALSAAYTAKCLFHVTY